MNERRIIMGSGYKVYIVIILILFFSLTYIIIKSESRLFPSASSFIKQCNQLYGDGNWQVHKISDFTTYSNDMWKTHPIIYTNVLDLNAPKYTCLNKS